MIRESELLKMINDSKPASSEQQPESELSKCEFVKPSEAASKLNIPLASVYALVRSGKMRAIYDTGRWRIPVEVVEERLKERGEQ
jgi:excisionase family DNA binding protein